MTNRDNDRIIAALASYQSLTRSLIIELAQAGAGGSTLARVVNALENIEGASCYIEDPNVGEIRDGHGVRTLLTAEPITATAKLSAEDVDAISKQILTAIATAMQLKTDAESRGH